MKYVCTVCGWVYDEDEAGVKWEDLPEVFMMGLSTLRKAAKISGRCTCVAFDSTDTLAKG